MIPTIKIQLIFLLLFTASSCKSTNSPSALSEKTSYYIEIHDLGLTIQDELLVRPENQKNWPPNIPIHKCTYNPNTDKGNAHFDCDDAAYAYKLWWDKNHSILNQSIWQTILQGYDLNKNQTVQHVMNIIQVHQGNVKAKRYCWIEPQYNTEVSCWLQLKGYVPKIPAIALKEYISQQNKLGLLNWKEESIQQVWSWNTAIWVQDAYQKHVNAHPDEESSDFTRNPASVKMFEEKTGLDVNTMKPIQK